MADPKMGVSRVLVGGCASWSEKAWARIKTPSVLVIRATLWGGTSMVSFPEATVPLISTCHPDGFRQRLGGDPQTESTTTPERPSLSLSAPGPCGQGVAANRRAGYASPGCTSYIDYKRIGVECRSFRQAAAAPSLERGRPDPAGTVGSLASLSRAPDVPILSQIWREGFSRFGISVAVGRVEGRRLG
jgi:hypothetical protein